jgi:hypothetical protein
MAYYTEYLGKEYSVFIETDNYSLKGNTLYTSSKTVPNVFYIEEYKNDSVIRQYAV